MVCNTPHRHQRSGCRNQWSDEQLQAALEAVRSGKMKAHAAAHKFCIPSSTLYDHLKGKSQRRYGGHPMILTCAEEKEIATSCQVLQEFGYPLTKDIVGIIVRDYITPCRRENQKFHSWVRLVGWFPALPVRSSHVTAVEVPSPLSMVGYFSHYLQRENAAKTKDSRGVKPRYYGEALTHDDIIQRMEEEEQQKGKRKPARGERGMRKPQQFKYRVKSM